MGVAREIRVIKRGHNWFSTAQLNPAILQPPLTHV